MCSKFYTDNPSENIPLGELLASVRAVGGGTVTYQEEEILKVLFECILVSENYVPPRELLMEARRLRDAHPGLIF